MVNATQSGTELPAIGSNLRLVSHFVKVRGSYHAMNLPSQDFDMFWVSCATRKPVPPSRPVVPVYRVGEPLQRGRRQWPCGAQFIHGRNGHELTLFLPEIDHRHVQDVKNGEGEFAVITLHPLIVLAYRFGRSVPWNDVPYCWHMQPPPYRVLPPQETSPETRALLWVTLVGAEDGIIHAQRGMTLAPEFTRILNAAIRSQARSTFDPDACAEAVSHLFIAHPTISDRLALAQSRTIGNQ